MRSMILAATLALSTLFAAAPAMAGEQASFPMPAAAFQQKVNAREAKAREHMEKRASALPADQAKALRDSFNAGEAKVNAEVAKAVADGTVTKDEAKEVHKVAREAHGGGHHHGKHAGRGKGQKGSKKQ